VCHIQQWTGVGVLNVRRRNRGSILGRGSAASGQDLGLPQPSVNLVSDSVFFWVEAVVKVITSGSHIPRLRILYLHSTIRFHCAVRDSTNPCRSVVGFILRHAASSVMKRSRVRKWWK
jgi:hypothetical protein